VVQHNQWVTAAPTNNTRQALWHAVQANTNESREAGAQSLSKLSNHDLFLTFHQGEV